MKKKYMAMLLAGNLFMWNFPIVSYVHAEEINKQDVVNNSEQNLEINDDTAASTETSSEKNNEENKEDSDVRLEETIESESSSEKPEDSQKEEHVELQDKPTETVDEGHVTDSAEETIESEAIDRSGVHGTSRWEFKADTGTITFYAGTFGGSGGRDGSAPWDVSRGADRVPPTEVKTIVIAEPIALPDRATAAFSVYVEPQTPPSPDNEALVNLTSIEGLDKVDTSKTTVMSSMFEGNSSLEELVLPFNTERVITNSRMFAGCTSLKSIDMSTWVKGNLLDSSVDTFFNTPSLGRIKLGPDGGFFQGMNGRMGLAAAPGSKSDRWVHEDGRSPLVPSAHLMGLYNTGYSYSPGWYVGDGFQQEYFWGTSPVSVSYYRNDVTNNTLSFEIGSGELGEAKDAPWALTTGFIKNMTNIGEIMLTGPVKAPANSKELFARSTGGATSLFKLSNLNYLDTSNVTNMERMFFEMGKTPHRGWGFPSFSGVKNFNTSNVTNMDNMFASSGAKKLNLDNFDTSKVTTMSNMFSGLTDFSELSLGSKFVFGPGAELPAPTPSDSGKWSKKDSSSAAYTPTEFMDNYGKGDLTAGAYVGDGQEKDTLFWGTAPWEFDEATGELTVEAGSLGANGEQPWKRSDEHKIDADAIKKIKFTEGVAAPQTCQRLFAFLPALTYIEGIEKLKMDNVLYTHEMFQGSGLKELDLSKWNTPRLTRMSNMFQTMRNLETLNLDVDTSNVTTTSNMYHMFDDTPNLKKLTLGNKFKFTGTDIDIGLPQAGIYRNKWMREDDTSKTYWPAEFVEKYGTGALTAGTYVKEDLKSWGTSLWEFDETSGVLTVEEESYGAGLGVDGIQPWKRNDAYKIAVAKIKKIKIAGKVYAPTNSTRLFASLGELQVIDGLANIDTSRVTDMHLMFQGTSKLTELNLSSWNLSNVRNMSNMFQTMGNLETLNLDVDTSLVTNMYNMLEDIPSLKKLTLGDKFKFVGTDAGLGAPSSIYENNGKWIREDGNSIGYTPADFMSNYGTGDLTSGTYVGEEKILWGTSPWIFDEETGILTIEGGELGEATTSPWNRTDKHKIDGTKVKKIVLTKEVNTPENSNYLFSKSASGSALPNMTTIEGMAFLKTDNATKMQGMFSKNEALTSIDVSSFNTSKVINMANMFSELTNLRMINGLTTFDTSKVINMTSMFSNTKAIKELDLSNFRTDELSTMGNMFSGMDLLSKLTLNDNFRFTVDASLPNPVGSASGKWTRKDGNSAEYSPKEFMENYGTGNLTAGEYIGDVNRLSITPTWNTPEIGNEGIWTGTISEATGKQVNKDRIKLDLANILSSEYIDLEEQDSIALTSYDSEGVEIEAMEIVDTSKPVTVTIDMVAGGHFELSMKGIAQNNTTKGIKNHKVEIENPLFEDKSEKIIVDQFLEIKSGDLKFTTVPDVIQFEKTTLAFGIEKLFINRDEEDWNITVSDLRGTNPTDSENEVIDRQNWELLATAQPFKDSKNREVGQDVLSVAYTSPEGETQFLTSDNESVIFQKDVSGEKPIEDKDTSVKASKNEGFRAYLSSASKVNRDETYGAQVDFELRQAP